jgi:hypothetical protein
MGIGTYGLRLLGIPENMLIVMAASYIFLMALGETGEQARFLLSVLPLVAALPAARVPEPAIATNPGLAPNATAAGTA